MIEKYTASEITEVIKELQQMGFKIDGSGKDAVFVEVAKNLKMDSYTRRGPIAVIPQEIRKAVYEICDYVTDNYEKKIVEGETTSHTECKRTKTVLPNKMNKYKSVMEELLLVIKENYVVQE